MSRLTPAKLTATVQTIVACVSIGHGFGKSENLLSAAQLTYILKVGLCSSYTYTYRG